MLTKRHLGLKSVAKQLLQTPMAPRPIMSATGENGVITGLAKAMAYKAGNGTECNPLMQTQLLMQTGAWAWRAKAP
jgi:hypothetical protein